MGALQAEAKLCLPSQRGQAWEAGERHGRVMGKEEASRCCPAGPSRSPGCTGTAQVGSGVLPILPGSPNRVQHLGEARINVKGNESVSHVSLRPDGL